MTKEYIEREAALKALNEAIRHQTWSMDDKDVIYQMIDYLEKVPVVEADIDELVSHTQLPREQVPETLTWCRQHYVPPVKEHIHCPEFGNSDGTNGSCWWCMEMTPYQWHMCKDESWVRGLLSHTARIPCMNREEAVQFIEDYKQKHPMGNERRALLSEADE